MVLSSFAEMCQKGEKRESFIVNLALIQDRTIACRRILVLSYKRPS